MSISIPVAKLQTPASVGLPEIESFVREDLAGEVPEGAEMVDLGSGTNQKARMGTDFVNCDEYPRRFEISIVITEVGSDAGDPITKSSGAGVQSCDS